MLLSFERGTPDRPRGHALAYVKHAGDLLEIYATYLVVPPITIDLAKYMPPMFASKMSLADMEQVSAIPLPPVPEKVESVRYLQRLAEQREDDLIFLGVMDANDVQRMLGHVAEASQEYLQVCNAAMERMTRERVERHPLEMMDPTGQTPLSASISATVDDVMFSLMSERDKLSELCKLVGKLRYAVDGRDANLAQETVEEMQSLARHLPDRYHVSDIIAAARTAGDKGRMLTELHITRCYKLSDEDFRAVEELEARIRQVQGGAG